MAIFLKVLAIIGIVILSILALLVLIVLLVLFVPVRYRAEGEFKDNKPKLTARVTWLLHIVSVKYILGENDPLSIKIFGFKLKNKEEEVPSFDDDDDEELDIPIPVSESVQISEASTVTESKPETVTEPKPETVSESKPESISVTFSESVSEATAETHETPEPEIKHKFKKQKKEKAPKHETENKDFENQSFYDKIKKYIEIIQSKRFKKAFEYSKKKIFKLLKHIKPGRIDIRGEVGFEDPSLTGTVIAVTSMLIPVFGNSVRITGNFEEPVISIEGCVKGRITIFKVLWTLAVLYFNRDLRKIIKMFREV